jgi:periplasmic copper chaperone A
VQRLGAPLFAAAVLGLVASLAAACTSADGAPELVVAGAWARETAGNPGENGAVYLTVVNEQRESDRLLGASVEEGVARMAHLHATVQQGELLRMTAVPAWDVEAEGGTLSLAPGGNHVMLLELAEPLRVGDRFILTLLFERAGERNATVVVRSVTGE